MPDPDDSGEALRLAPLMFLLLRCFAGLCTLAALVGFLVMTVVARDLRRAFGGGQLPPLEILVQVVLPLLGLLVLGLGVFTPERSLLLHAGAGVAAALVVACLANASTPTFVGIALLMPWLCYYVAAMRWSLAPAGLPA